MKSILLTFDLEEFDIPREYSQNIGEEEMFEISKKGLLNLLKIIEKYDLKVTFFTTTNFAKRFPKQIREISKNHEIASHGYSHSGPLTLESIKKGLAIKEKIINKKISGFRAPRYHINDFSILKSEFDYDSSSHPIFLPGRYFNISKKRYIHKIDNLIEIPISTLPILNLSLFWLAFKNFPLTYAKVFTKLNFLYSNYTMLVMHPWEFNKEIKNYRIPFYTKTNPKKLLEKLGALFLLKNIGLEGNFFSSRCRLFDAPLF